MTESFLKRWARLKSEEQANIEPVEAQRTSALGDDPYEALSMEDVRRLRPDSDFSGYLARNVNPDVRRAALKTLFSDPHFQQMDGLDIYIGDYTKPSPLTPEMVAALWHSRSTLAPQPLYPVDERQDPDAGKDADIGKQDAGATEAAVPSDMVDAGVVDPGQAEAEVSSPAGTPLSFNEEVNFSNGSEANCNRPRSD